jgi:predicted membrane-bound spermidine synthase
VGTRLFAEQIVRPRRLQVACVAAIAVLSAAFAGGSRINAFAEDNIYADEIILSRRRISTLSSPGGRTMCGCS